MSGIVFFRSANRDRVVEWYVSQIGFDRWLEQEGGCTILQCGNLRVGFCDAEYTETDGILTVVVESRQAVDERYEQLKSFAEDSPTVNEAFDIYHFFMHDPDGRTIEIQTFLHELPPS